jgi:hypothetical protein
MSSLENAHFRILPRDEAPRIGHAVPVLSSAMVSAGYFKQGYCLIKRNSQLGAHVRRSITTSELASLVVALEVAGDLPAATRPEHLS